MTTVIDDTTLMRVVALTALPEFIDIYGNITGTRNAVYNPTFVGERGFMMHVTAAPLDIGVVTTGDQLAICFNHTPLAIDTAIAAATPIVVVFGGRKQKPVPAGPYHVVLNDKKMKYWVDLSKELVLFDAIGGDEFPEASVTFTALPTVLKDYLAALADIQSQISKLLKP